MELVVARVALYLTLLPATGLPLWLATAGRREAQPRSFRPAVAVLAGLAVAASAWSALAMIADMTAQPVAALDRQAIVMVTTATPIGTTTFTRIGMLIVLALPLPRQASALAAVAALSTLAFTGHAGAGEALAGSVHRVTDTAHLAAAACWIGALLALLATAWTTPAAAARRLANFATTGSLVVVLLVVTGIANAMLIAGRPLPLKSDWSLALAIKLALFAAMLSLAALNRWKLVPALSRASPASARRIRMSLAVEALLGFAVLIVVGWLGLLDPAG